ncbi:MAG: hypothetical protein WCV99_18400 [Sterolibacterium sp.]|jgi:hypothetical protein
MKFVRKILLAGGLALTVTAASAQPTAVIDAAMRQETVEGGGCVALTQEVQAFCLRIHGSLAIWS